MSGASVVMVQTGERCAFYSLALASVPGCSIGIKPGSLKRNSKSSFTISELMALRSQFEYAFLEVDISASESAPGTPPALVNTSQLLVGVDGDQAKV